MPSPLGHALAGLALAVALAPGARVASAAVLAVAASLSPDLDFVPGLLVGDPGRYHHHGASHSVGAAAAAALLGGALAASPYGRATGLASVGAGRAALLCGLAVLAHVVLDALAVDTSRPYGVALLWPFDGAYLISPWTPFADIQREESDASAFFRTLASSHNLRAVVVEAALIGPLVLLAVLARRRTR
ncbi:MAG TPA: metal-dependent hydrolase [Thermodesulfobacteriota bacterium]